MNDELIFHIQECINLLNTEGINSKELVLNKLKELKDKLLKERKDNK